MLYTELFLSVLAFTLALSIVIISIPPILRVAKAKNLFDPIDERKIHTKIVPPLGGVGIFIGFVISTIISTDGYTFDGLKYIIAAVILMFFIGLKDDLLAISARKKFTVQVFASVLLITLGNFHIHNLHGFLGIYEVNFVFGTLITLFLILTIVNAYNLIDGIDGLASGLAILASVFFGFWFFMAGFIQYSIMAFAMAGSLTGFFFFNVFGNANKLFMGDTGSLVVGMIMAVFVIKFNEFNVGSNVAYFIEASPSVSFAVVLVPLIDTLRVMTIRLLNGKSPFSPDNNHIHHRLLQLVPSHLAVTLIIIASNVFIIGIALLLNSISFNVNLQFLIIFALGIFFSFLPSQIIRWREVKQRKQLKFAGSAT